MMTMYPLHIDIKHEKSKNIIIGSIYRHPRINNDNFNNFLKYVEFSLNNLTKENKEIYLCGDFNIDLLKIDELTNYKKFYELMSSYGLLPQILNPTREIGNSSTIIDKIFTNNISNSIQSGNILTDLSDHYSQFIMVNRDKLDAKRVVTTLNVQLTASEMMFQFKTSMLNLTMLMINLMVFTLN